MLLVRRHDFSPVSFIQTQYCGKPCPQCVRPHIDDYVDNKVVTMPFWSTVEG
jgi:hypothetical protein